MTDLILTALRLVFLGFLVLYVVQVARAMGRHVGPIARAANRAATQVVIVRSDTQAGTTHTVKDSSTFGRSEDADVLIDDPYASEFHLRFTAEDDRLVLTDLGSTNGTYLNGRPVSAPVGVKRGDAVQVGKTVMEVR